MLPKNSSLVTFVINLSMLIAVTAADVDCSKRPQRVNPKTCCPMPDLFTAEMKEKCKEFDKAPPMSHHHHNPCFMSCVLNETGIIADDKLDEDKLSDFLNAVLKDVEEMIPIVQESFQTCAAEGEEFRAKMKNNPRMPPPPGAGTQPPCRTGPGFMMGCVFMTSFKNCAASVWNDNGMCNDMREHIINCKRGRGPGGPGGPPKFN